MSIVVRRQKSLHFDLIGAECETPHLKAMLFDRLKQTYEGTCMDSCYILRIIRIVGEPAPREFNPRKMNGEMKTSVIFEYDAEMLIAQSETKSQAILHEGKIHEITEHEGGVIAMCAFGNHITGTILADLHGILTIGMTIPVRVADAEYPQSTLNNINVRGELLRPAHFNARYMLVGAGTEADIATANANMTKLNEHILAISAHKRAQYFKAWLYPYKSIPPGRKPTTLSSLLTKRSTKSMYVSVDDACDIANLEFVQIAKIQLVDKIGFVQFTDILIAEAARMWDDIDKFCKIYDSDTEFNAHKTIWTYYSNGKFDPTESASAAAQSIAKSAKSTSKKVKSASKTELAQSATESTAEAIETKNE